MNDRRAEIKSRFGSAAFQATARAVSQFFSRTASGAASLSGRLLFPPVCPGCRRMVVQPFTLCGQCWPELRFIEQPWCEVLGTPFSYEIGKGIVSAEALANPPPFARARSAVSYKGVAQHMVMSLKFSDRTELAPVMARWMMRAGAELLADADAVVPVPLHRTRFFQRRFNQSAELARALCALSGKPFLPEAVTRIRATRQQVGLAAREREANVRGAFHVPQRAGIHVQGKHILVVDDVYTTGMTVASLARTLRRAGAAQIDVLTFARVLPARSYDDAAALGAFRQAEEQTI